MWEWHAVYARHNDNISFIHIHLLFSLKSKKWLQNLRDYNNKNMLLGLACYKTALVSASYPIVLLLQITPKKLFYVEVQETGSAKQEQEDDIWAPTSLILSWFVTQCCTTGFASYLVRKCFTNSHFQIWINAELFAWPTSQLSLEETGGDQRRPISIHMAKLMSSKKTVEALVFPFSTSLFPWGFGF